MPLLGEENACFGFFLAQSQVFLETNNRGGTKKKVYLYNCDAKLSIWATLPLQEKGT
jgi:hypothetical protein